MADGRALGAPVGIGRENDRADVVRVQRMLNAHAGAGEARLAADHVFGPRTQARLLEYQRDVVRLRHPDGIVDVDGPTMRSLSRPAAHEPHHAAVAGHYGHAAAPEGALERFTDRHPSQVHRSSGKQQFIDEMLPHARAVQERYGIPASVTLAQGAVESQWGQKAPDNAYFGVKGYAPDGKSVILMTHEEKDGERILLPQRFRAYDSMGAAADDYGRVLSGQKRFKPAFDHPDDGYAFVKEIAAHGYATDHRYLTTLTDTMRANDLTQYDHPPRLHPEAAPSPRPRTADAPAAGSVGEVAPPDAQSYWKALAAKGREVSTARQSSAAAFDPTHAAASPSTVRSGQVDAATAAGDVHAGWRATVPAGPDAAAQPQPAQAAPVATPSAPRMKM